MCNIIKEEIVNSDIIKEECVKSGVIQEESVKIDGKTMSLLIGPNTIYIRMGSVLANRARYYIY